MGGGEEGKVGSKHSVAKFYLHNHRRRHWKQLMSPGRDDDFCQRRRRRQARAYCTGCIDAKEVGVRSQYDAFCWAQRSRWAAKEGEVDFQESIMAL